MQDEKVSIAVPTGALLSGALNVLARSGLAQIAFSTGRRAIAQLKLGLPSTAFSAPTRSSSSASDRWLAFAAG